jgi:hypothetical protein
MKEKRTVRGAVEANSWALLAQKLLLFTRQNVGRELLGPANPDQLSSWFVAG